jgi:6,7-dimethyl-8-ribityllumazine synthase
VSSGPGFQESNQSGAGLRIALVATRWNEPIVETLLKGALATLSERGVAEADMLVGCVPGAVELPLLAAAYAQREDIDAVIALGCVVRGETGHYDVVVEMAASGLMRAGLDAGKPVIFGVLTTENEAQAWDRAGGAHGNNGSSAADTAIATVLALRKARTS